MASYTQALRGSFWILGSCDKRQLLGSLPGHATSAGLALVAHPVRLWMNPTVCLVLVSRPHLWSADEHWLVCGGRSPSRLFRTPACSCVSYSPSSAGSYDLQATSSCVSDETGTDRPEQVPRRLPGWSPAPPGRTRLAYAKFLLSSMSTHECF